VASRGCLGALACRSGRPFLAAARVCASGDDHVKTVCVCAVAVAGGRCVGRLGLGGTAGGAGGGGKGVLLRQRDAMVAIGVSFGLGGCGGVG
jgi:hypothetical protein